MAFYRIKSFEMPAVIGHIFMFSPFSMSAPVRQAGKNDCLQTRIVQFFPGESGKSSLLRMQSMDGKHGSATLVSCKCILKI